MDISDINPSSLRYCILRATTELGYQAFVDLKICEEVCTHWKRDIEKLISFHNHDHGVGLEKVIGYLSFWIRKLKPVSNSNPIKVDKENGKVHIIGTYQQSLINELVSIYIIKMILLDYCDNKIKTSKSLDKKCHYESIKSNAENNFNYLLSSLGTQDFKKSFLYTCLYDMRYRTFGPHHVVHVVRFFLSGIDIQLLNKSFCIQDVLFTSRQKVLLMQVFISAPGEIQSKKLKSKIVDRVIEDGIIIKIFNNNYKKWIKQFGVAVIPVYQDDFSSRISQKSAEYEILRQLYEEQLMDVYCGLIDSKFGTPVDGVGSGTEAEYLFAKENLDYDLIMFGKNDILNLDNASTNDIQQALLVREFFNKEGNAGLLYWSYQEDSNNSNFEQKFIDQIEKKIITFKEKFS